jgi:hypothetical protein
MNENQTSPGPDPMTEKPGQEVVTDRNFQFKRLWFFMLNSIILYIFSYFIIYYFSQIVSYIIAVNLDITSVFYYFELNYSMATMWDLPRTFAVSTVGPIIVFIIGLIAVNNTFKLKNISPYLKMFIAWLAYHGINYFMGSLLAGSFTGIGVGYTLDLFFYPNMFIYVFIVLFAIAFLAYIGHITSEFFLATSPSLYWLQSRNHSYYLNLTLLIPYLIGTLIIYLIKYPDHLPQRPEHITYDLIVTFSMFFIIFPMLFRRFVFDLTPKIPVRERTRTIHFTFLILTIFVVAFFRIIFS